MEWTEYLGWQIKAHRQCDRRMPFVAYGKRDNGKYTEMFNEEGSTADEALSRVKRTIETKKQ